ncbi:MAG: endonuclease III [Lachnospiraceae bacterium]|nr:endonuclease III [Lachnospiraceae bacterium]
MINDCHVNEILELLDKQYGTELYCFLEYKNAYELLVATILAAQCTDARVNVVTKHLFPHYPDAFALAKADVGELEEEIHELGFFRAKARNLIAMARILVEKHNGEVPGTLEELTELPGVGRKTANVIRGNVYHVPSVVVDTHVKRITKRLGLTENTEPEKIEYDLMRVLPEDHWILWNLHIITFGRTICTAQRPKCSECFLSQYCQESH